MLDGVPEETARSAADMVSRWRITRARWRVVDADLTQADDVMAAPMV
jgi:hypothetical protein